MRVYLAGPMKGKHFNYPQFLAAAEDLRKSGYEVMSPAENTIAVQTDWDYRSDSLDGFDPVQAWRWNVAQILDPDLKAVVLLPDWRLSEGALMEVRLARYLQKDVFEFDPQRQDRLKPVPARHEGFHRLLLEIGALHDRKQADYGSDDDPFANVRASTSWGIPAWVGALLRLNDKVVRLQSFARKGALANESAEDSMMDIATYSLIAMCLYREESEVD